ncbi:hypothetical protein [Streptomyces sp. NPDC088270]|uniref:hypothetical protein n=1 Tax=unclassified Streptomyces TaxID=2593676 RepID=UPI003414ED36
MVADRDAPGRLVPKALEAGVAGCREEARTAHPGGGRPVHALEQPLPRDLRDLRRGIRQRTIYQHTVRSDRTTLAEVAGRIIVFDRDLAFVPFSDEPHRALRIQHPALVRFLARHFDEAWARIRRDPGPVPECW